MIQSERSAELGEKVPKELIWKYLVERLALEEAMQKQIGRCMVFFFSFFQLLAAMWITFPASRLASVHEYLKVAYRVDNAMKLRRPDQILTFIQKYRMEYSPYLQDNPTDALTVPVMPPLVMQERYKREDCAEFDPALVMAIRKNHGSHVQLACNSPILDSTPFVSPSAFRCTSTLFGGVPVYQLPTDLNATAPIPAAWIDSQTHTVTLLDAFVSPIRRSGTLLSLRWQQVHGLFRYDGEMLSYVEMDASEQKLWLLLSLVTILLCVVELFVIAFIFIGRLQGRRNWYLAVREVTDSQQQYLRDKNAIKQAVPLVNVFDIADIVIRVLMMSYIGLRGIQLYTSKLHHQDVKMRFGSFSAKMLNVLESHRTWMEEGDEDNKKARFSEFFSSVESLKNSMTLDFYIRIGGYFLILICLLRGICYFKVHPRMAVLYLTLYKSANDLKHFLIVFLFLFFVLAFSAAWMFGSENPRFSSMSVASLTQFQMLLGDFSVLPSNVDSGDARVKIFTVYIGIYVCMCFFVLLNFFLAIIIDAYVAVNQKVKECAVEQSIWADMLKVVSYPFWAFYYKWPTRARLLDYLLREKMEGRWYDSNGNEMISLDEILSTGLFEGSNANAAATKFMVKYGELEVLQTGVENKIVVHLDHLCELRGLDDLAHIARLLPDQFFGPRRSIAQKLRNFARASLQTTSRLSRKLGASASLPVTSMTPVHPIND